MPLLASRGLPVVSKEKLFQACVCSVILYGSETWPVKKEDIKRLERNDVRMIRLMCEISLNDKVSVFCIFCCCFFFK